MIDEKTLLRHNVIEAASALCKLMSEEDWHNVISLAEHEGAISEDMETLAMAKLTDLAQAVQDYEA